MTFTLQLLHAADQEGGIPALEDAPRFSAVLNALRNDGFGSDGTLTLSSGDAYIPGPFFSASTSAIGAQGLGDILIQNELGFEAIAFGNHEFDLGTGVIETLITADGLYPGTAFPYLSTNLDFSSSNLSGLVVPGGSAPQVNSISSSVVINKGGIDFGIVGATTPNLASISSSGDVIVNGTNGIDDLASVIQSEIDALTNAGIDHIILLAHMQQLSIERQLAERLENVDIIIAGGSNSILVDGNDRLRPGDTADDVYPIIIDTDENGGAKDPVAVVNTDGNYRYVGQLVVTFDNAGVIDPSSIDPNVSGAYATDDVGVAALNAQNLVDPEIALIANQLETAIASLDGSIFGNTEVFLNGTRADVRTQETNLGNLTADANLFIARQTDPTVQVSLKNGGGIRDNIGVVTFPPGSTDPDDVLKLPPAANALANKEEGDISQLDVSNALRFNNGLTLLTVTAQELEQIIEHGISESEPGATPGRFPQVGGLNFSFDLSQTPIEFDDSGTVVTDGERVRNLAIVDDNGRIVDVIARNGQLVGNPNREIRMVTLNFLAGGGDDYPYPAFGDNVVDLVNEVDPPTGAATDAPDGSEQDALAEYLLSEFSDTSFSQRDTLPRADRRIQNLDERNDTVFNRRFFLQGSVRRDVFVGGNRADVLNTFGGNDFVAGQAGNDRINGGSGNDRLAGNFGNDVVIGGSGEDNIRGGLGRDRLIGQSDNDIIRGDGGNDVIIGGAGNDFLRGGTQNDRLFGQGNADRIFGDSGNDFLNGGVGNDRIDPGAGRDVIVTGTGRDRIVINRNTARQGLNIVRDFQNNLDKIDLVGIRFRDVDILQRGQNTLIRINGENSVFLQNTNANLIDARDFV
jgi:2',3'-cyclic-nucleotide 2'-phosphodiesterase (5'-nucleotidase family)